MTVQNAAPVSSSERITDLDVLRGFALFGVLIANIVGLVVWNYVTTEAQLEASSFRTLDRLVHFAVRLFVDDKANTLFAFLFGLGFYVQMSRLSERGVEFAGLYARRLLVLFVIGLIHLIFIWFWDILHLYAVLGFGLLLVRRASDRMILFWGIGLAVLGRLVFDIIFDLAGFYEAEAVDAISSEVAILHRQALSASGDYWALVQEFWTINWFDYFKGPLVGWALYTFGRFLLGMWVGRKQWLHRAGDFLPGFRRVFFIALPLGLALEAVNQLGGIAALSGESFASDVLSGLTHMVATPLIAAGYTSGLVLALRTGWGAKIFGVLAPVGRMALTNYVMQSFIIGFTLFGIGPGLDLMSHATVTIAMFIAVTGFSGQIIFSYFWLKAFNFGPLEWVWRALTYGNLPRMRKA
ncbi:MAG: membrane protein [Hyphobacterium sp.]|nr:MAG: membrane protein [Hyphobacterium sp.]